MAQNLSSNVDFIVCACNTAHAFQQAMKQGCGITPFVSMIDVTSDEVKKRLIKSGKSMKCGVLGGVGCIQADLYQ